MQVIAGARGGGGTATGSGPIVHIHHIERHVHGNGIAVKVWGEMKIAAKEYVYAREMKLNTVKVINFTPETGNTSRGYTVQKWINNKGEFDNYASVDIYILNPTGPTVTQMDTGNGPADGSLWLDFEAMGE